MVFAILSLLLAISGLYLFGTFGFILSSLSIIFGLISIKEKSSKIAITGISISVLSIAFLLILLLGSVVGIVEIVTDDPEVSSGSYYMGDGTFILSVITILIAIILHYFSSKKGVLRPAIAGVISSIVGFLISLINPYLAIFMLANSYVCALRELLWIRAGIVTNSDTTNLGEFKKQSIDWQAVFGLIGLAFIGFFSGLWMIISVREALGINVYEFDPATGEGFIEANWVFWYLGFWALVILIFIIVVSIKEYGVKKVSIAPFKFIATGDWTVIYEDKTTTRNWPLSHLIRSTRDNPVFNIFWNFGLRAFVLFIIWIIIFSL